MISYITCPWHSLFDCNRWSFCPFICVVASYPAHCCFLPAAFTYTAPHCSLCLHQGLVLQPEPRVHPKAVLPFQSIQAQPVIRQNANTQATLEPFKKGLFSHYQYKTITSIPSWLVSMSPHSPYFGCMGGIFLSCPRAKCQDVLAYGRKI